MVKIEVVTILVINIVRNTSLKNAKEKAIIVGAFVELICVLVLNHVFALKLNPVLVIVLTLVSLIISLIVLWAVLPLNYKEVEYVEFYDDEYYYFVKAVPLNSLQKG